MRLTWQQILSLDLLDYFYKHQTSFTKCAKEVLLPEFNSEGEQKVRIDYFYSLSSDTYKEILEIIKSRQKMPFVMIPAEKTFQQSVNNLKNKAIDEITPVHPGKFEKNYFEDDEGIYTAFDYSLEAFEITGGSKFRDSISSYPYRDRNAITTEELLNDLKNLV